MKIYHYTSMQTLALILNEGKLKFNRLDNVDDLEESMYTSGVNNINLNKYCFVSCWTRSSEENISLWKMYTDFKGVRIGLDDDMLVTYPHFGTDNWSYFKEEPYLYNDCLFSGYFNHPKLHDIIYKDKIDEDIKGFILNAPNHSTVATDSIGIYKREEWKFQNECRFKLFALPYESENESSIDMKTPFGAFYNLGIKTLRQKEIFLPIKPEKLAEIEVMLGPKTSRGDEIIVKALLSKFAQSKVIRSYFHGKIR